MYKIWIDEAWRWPWLWPVVACSLAFNPDNPPDSYLLEEFDDSKKITEKKRNILYKQLIELSIWDNPKVFFWVWVVDNFIIDDINIKQANREAMRRSLVEILRKINKDEVRSVLIDWNDNYKFDELNKNPLFIIWWDWKVKEIWAASIIAKVFRDKLIATYSELYPDMWLEWHKWYWTKKHSEYLWNNKSHITWIHRLSYKPIKKILDYKPKLLLHICCWPDATIPIIDFKNKYDITCFWYDPNIQPKIEHDKRLDAFIKVCKLEKIKYVIWEYDVPNFMKSIAWLENTPERWEKCTKCYDMRLDRTARLANELDIINRTTSLNISPHKCLETIYKIWQKLDKKYKLNFLEIDFKKKDWFNRSVEYCKNNNIYRQNYCWCIYSDTFPKEFKNIKDKFKK